MNAEEHLEKIITVDLPVLPGQQWFSLREACFLKGCSYKTVLNRKELQPHPCEYLGGARKYSRAVILEWLGQTDKDLLLQSDSE